MTIPESARATSCGWAPELSPRLGLHGAPFARLLFRLMLQAARQQHAAMDARIPNICKGVTLAIAFPAFWTYMLSDEANPDEDSRM